MPEQIYTQSDKVQISSKAAQRYRNKRFGSKLNRLKLDSKIDINQGVQLQLFQKTKNRSFNYIKPNKLKSIKVDKFEPDSVSGLEQWSRNCTVEDDSYNSKWFSEYCIKRSNTNLSGKVKIPNLSYSTNQ